jgi:hypothetical protein
MDFDRFSSPFFSAVFFILVFSRAGTIASAQGFQLYSSSVVLLIFVLLIF